MAKLFRWISWIFCLRPITWFLSKVIKNKTVLGFILEIFYLGLAVLYLAFSIIGIKTISSDNYTAFYFVALIIGIPGMLMLGYGIMKYHKTEEDMSEDSFEGYKGSASYNEYNDTVSVSVSESYRERFSWEGLIAVFTAPLQVLIRTLNLFLMFRCVFDKEYICDLAYNCHPDEDGTFKTILIDIVNINRF